MLAIIFLLFSICVVAISIFLSLAYFIRRNSKIATKVEIFGYILLVVSLLWGFIVSDTTDIANGNKDLILNEKLNILWKYEGKKARNIDDISNYQLSQEYLEDNDNWVYWNYSGDTINMQERLVNIAHYFIAGLSTVFIAAGRMSEVLDFKRNEKKSVRGIYRNSKKRKG